MKNKIQVIIYIKIFTIILLLWALADNPYFYYQILRWIIAGTLGYSAYFAYKNEQTVWMWIFGIIVILYNPIAPIHFERVLWSIMDVIVAGIIFASFFKKKADKASSSR